MAHRPMAGGTVCEIDGGKTLIGGTAYSIKNGRTLVGGTAYMIGFAPDTLPVVLEVEKITSDTYAGETTYTGEQFILLDIYPKTYGTVKVTYGGLTKTVTDTSGAAEPNAQQVFFGTFNGVSDSVATPASGTLTVEGEYYAFGCSNYAKSNKATGSDYCLCITEVLNFGGITVIPHNGFSSGLGGTKISNGEFPNGLKEIRNSAFFGCTNLSVVTIPSTVESIGDSCFLNSGLQTVVMLGATPPELKYRTGNSGEMIVDAFGSSVYANFALEKIIVPKGSGNAYKTAIAWSAYADYITEES